MLRRLAGLVVVSLLFGAGGLAGAGEGGWAGV